ncbi:MAG TPA: hypothetical protein VFP69_10815 [Streptomyces sp.]|nr:hypothetical protein [Streptomyces sp.]
MIPPALVPVGRRGELRCGCQETPVTPPCGRPAAWHILWHLTPKPALSLACGPHMAWVQKHFVYLDRHPALHACDMPGTAWTNGQPGQCLIPPHPHEAPHE